MKLVKGLTKIPSLAAAATFAVAGLGFALSTVIMGRVLAPATFGLAVLVIAFCNVGAATAAAGLNGVVVQHGLASGRRLLLVSLCVSLVAAILSVTIARAVYGLDLPALAALFAAVLAGGFAFTAVSGLQREQQFQRAAMLSQAANLGLLLACLLMIVGIGRDHWFPTAFVAGVFLVWGIVAWRHVSKMQGGLIEGRHWKDAAHYYGLAFAGELYVQVERFIIPLILTLDDLSKFSVIAALILAPFRVLELGANSTLPAQMRTHDVAAARRALLLRDAGVLIALCIAGGAVLVLIGPWVCNLVMKDETFPTALMIAMVATGTCRVLAAMAQGLAKGVCTSAELSHVHGTTWFTLAATAAGAAILGLEFGLAGVIYGGAFGSLLRAALIFRLAYRHIRVNAA